MVTQPKTHSCLLIDLFGMQFSSVTSNIHGHPGTVDFPIAPRRASPSPPFPEKPLSSHPFRLDSPDDECQHPHSTIHPQLPVQPRTPSPHTTPISTCQLQFSTIQSPSGMSQPLDSIFHLRVTLTTTSSPAEENNAIWNFRGMTTYVRSPSRTAAHACFDPLIGREEGGICVGHGSRWPGLNPR